MSTSRWWTGRRWSSGGTIRRCTTSSRPGWTLVPDPTQHPYLRCDWPGWTCDKDINERMDTIRRESRPQEAARALGRDPPTLLRARPGDPLRRPPGAPRHAGVRPRALTKAWPSRASTTSGWTASAAGYFYRSNRTSTTDLLVPLANWASNVKIALLLPESPRPHLGLPGPGWILRRCWARTSRCSGRVSCGSGCRRHPISFLPQDLRREPQRSQLRQLRAHRAEHDLPAICRARTSPRAPEDTCPGPEVVALVERSEATVGAIGEARCSGRSLLLGGSGRSAMRAGGALVLFGSLLLAAGAFGAADEEELGRARAIRCARRRCGRSGAAWSAWSVASTRCMRRARWPWAPRRRP